MRQTDINRKLFHKGHYEIIAARFRTALTPLMTDDGVVLVAARASLINLAMELARRFMADNEDFSPEMFLSRCSPDPIKYPLNELWRDNDS